MSGVKRTLSTQLTSIKSEANPSVTLFELHEEVEHAPRRSKRVRTERKVGDDLELDDLELEEPKPLFKKRSKSKALVTPAGPAPAGSGSRKKRDAKSPKKVKLIPQFLEKPHPAPENWKETYDTIKAMRSRFVAPVDTMGCGLAQAPETDPKNRRFTTLVSLMLSSQTKDEVQDAAIKKIRAALGGSISVQGIIDTEPSTLSKAICKVGFWNRKTEYIKGAALKLRDEFDSDVPKTVDELCSIKGVGPKMAFLTLQWAWGINVGIGVDVHVHRITNLLGWHKPPTKTPEQTRLNLQSWLPKELHGDINNMLVGFGQVICLPVSPRCDVCDLAPAGLCPSARKVTNIKNRKEIIFSPSKDAQPKIEIEIEALEETFVPPSPKIHSGSSSA